MITIRDLKRALDENNIKYQDGENNTIVFTNYSSKTSANYIFVITIEDGYADVGLNLNRMDRSNLNERVKETINELNQKYRFFKFYYSEVSYNQFDIRLSATAIVKENNSVDEVLELIWRGLDVADTVYPDIQRAIWR